MITLKFRKTDAMAYVSHIDLLRHIERTMRRTGLPVGFSQGYNPHLLLNLGATLPLGASSIAEYFTVDTTAGAAEFLARYNACCVLGLVGEAAWKVDKNPNLAGKVVAADYRIPAYCGDKAEAVANLINRPQYVIDYPSKKDAGAKKDVMPYLYALRVEEDCVTVCVGAGNDSVKPALLAQAMGNEFGINFDLDNIVRRAQYVRVDGILTDVEGYLAQLATEYDRV